MLEAGRELDALVAEKVLGECAHREQEKYVCQDDWGFHCVVCGSEKECPKYSTDIKAAMEVFKKAMGFLFSQRKAFFKELQNIATKLADLDYPELVAWPDVLMILVKQDVLPKAICHAALKAVGVSE